MLYKCCLVRDDENDADDDCCLDAGDDERESI